MDTYRIVLLCVIISVTTSENPVWNGPLADHKIGQLVQDTPEVVAAKRLHSEIYSKVRAILPELKEEDADSQQIQQVISQTPVPIVRSLPLQQQSKVFPQARQFISEATPSPVIRSFTPQKQAFPQDRPFIPEVTSLPPQQFDFQSESQSRWPGPFADHVLGQQVQETPEVAAARRHHELVFSMVRSILPEIPLEEHKETNFQFPEMQAVIPKVSVLKAHLSDLPMDTPEVAAAKLAHARALAAVLGN